MKGLSLEECASILPETNLLLFGRRPIPGVWWSRVLFRLLASYNLRHARLDTSPSLNSDLDKAMDMDIRIHGQRFQPLVTPGTTSQRYVSMVDESVIRMESDDPRGNTQEAFPQNLFVPSLSFLRVSPSGLVAVCMGLM